MYQLRQKTDLEVPQIVPTVHAIMGGSAASDFSRLVYNFAVLLETTPLRNDERSEHQSEHFRLSAREIG